MMRQEEIKEVIKIDESEYRCRTCGGSFKVSAILMLTKETIERDIANDVFIGNARVDCPICYHPNYFCRE